MTARSDLIRKRAIVRGTVQGVGYRVSAQAEANRLGVFGTVRNLYDGSVETEAEGEAAAVEAYVDWLHSGPSWAKVTAVDVIDVQPKGETTFRIR
ncbi:MAG TPA: acylphosphatase [Candidatus Agrococcus pullicola]|uniref:acylphosphatase n=1 Tax=Candidatus Agrococcus pullicola TaxID=2838429 RepID=A0A9D2C9T8_9MICO|nr:acylphosphatase [Candidatus Agrococcus pullicola]